MTNDQFKIDLIITYHTATPDGTPVITEPSIQLLVEALDLISDPSAKASSEALLGLTLAYCDAIGSHLTHSMMSAFINKTRNKYHVPWEIEYIDITEQEIFTLQ